MSLFAVQTIWKQTQYYGCCNQHGFPALMRLWETLPKTRGFTLSQEIVHLLGQIPLKQKTKLLIKTAVILYLKWLRQTGRMLPLKPIFPSDVWAKALEATVSESGHQLRITRVLRMSVSLSWTAYDNPAPDKNQAVTAKEFRSNIHCSKRFY